MKLLVLLIALMALSARISLKRSKRNRLRNRYDPMHIIRNLLRDRMLPGPADAKSFPNPPEAMLVLSPMVKNPNLEITTYGELENVDLAREPVVSTFSSKRRALL